MAVLLAFTLEHAARVTGVSERRIRYWDQTGVLSPSLSRTVARRGPYSRIYSFRDLVGLRTLRELRDRYGLSLQRLREIGKWLRETYNEPWSSLRFYIVGRGRTADVIFHDPKSEAFLSTRRRHQAVMKIELEPIARETEEEAKKLTIRSEDQIGKIVQNRYILGNAPVLAGTRIPTAAVWDFYKAGHDAAAILREYPRLTPVDVERAIAFEEERRSARAS
jgi:uncharacterized protein (DUF433 family)